MIKDVIEGLKLVGDGIKSVKTIVEAVKSGKDYLRANHPEVKSDLRAMVAELAKSLFVIKRASATLTNFRFAVATDAQGAELSRFNDYFIQSKAEAQLLRNHIEDLRTHCSKIRDHGSKIAGMATASGFTKVFGFLGLSSPQREAELGEQLDKLAYEDFAVANTADRMVECLEAALKDVQNALGSGGSMYPDKVPAAAALLAEYGPEFDAMEDRASEAAREIRDLVGELDR